MADKKDEGGKPLTNDLGQPANQETSIRDAKHPDEKPDVETVAQVEEIKQTGAA